MKQASFLMVAGLIVRMIGLLYRTPMKAAIGGSGTVITVMLIMYTIYCC